MLIAKKVDSTPAAGSACAAPRPRSERFMWLTDDRVLYVGLFGAPTVRTMGSLAVYVATAGKIHLRLPGGDWQTGEVAVVPPYMPYELVSDARMILAVKAEAETVDMTALPPLLASVGVVDDPAFAQRVRRTVCELREQGRSVDLAALNFDALFFGEALKRRVVDPRIQRIIDAIKRDPSAPLAAEDCAQSVHLSFSRFLHLFKQDVGAPFRSFRTWKRARSLLHYVNRDANLAHVALDTGYPDSTHFSHSIRQTYGLKPRDIFAGSRKLAIFGRTLTPA
jgi:AraC-like DNA-binding protein